MRELEVEPAAGPPASSRSRPLPSCRAGLQRPRLASLRGSFRLGGLPSCWSPSCCRAGQGQFTNAGEPPLLDRGRVLGARDAWMRPVFALDAANEDAEVDAACEAAAAI